MQLQAKKLKQYFDRAYPTHEWWPQRSTGQVMLGRTPVVRVIVPTDPDRPSTLQWNRAEATRLRIDFSEVGKHFKEAWASPEEVQWSSCS